MLEGFHFIKEDVVRCKRTIFDLLLMDFSSAHGKTKEFSLDGLFGDAKILSDAALSGSRGVPLENFERGLRLVFPEEPPPAFLEARCRSMWPWQAAIN